MIAAPALALGGIQAGLSAYQGIQNNARIRDSMARANVAASNEIAQQGRAAKFQTTRTRQDAARVRGTLGVAAAERGVGFGGSVEALDRNAAIQGEQNAQGIRLSRYGAEQSTLSQLEAAQAQLDAQSSNIFLSGLSGGISGFSTGLSIGRGIKDLQTE